MLAPITYTQGEKIKYYRMQKGLTQLQLANLCNLTDTAIRNYERDVRTPNRDTLEDIAAALQISVYALLDSYPANSLHSSAHFLMESSFQYNAHPDIIDGKPAIIFDSDLTDIEKMDMGSFMSSIITNWSKVYQFYVNGIITLEEYHSWISRYPENQELVFSSEDEESIPLKERIKSCKNKDSDLCKVCPYFKTICKGHEE